MHRIHKKHKKAAGSLPPLSNNTMTSSSYGLATQSASVMLSSSEMNRVGWLNV